MGLFNGLFGPHNQSLMGDSFVIDPGVSGSPTNLIVQNPIGKTIFLSAEQRFNTVHSILAVSSTPIGPYVGNVTFAGMQQMLQLSLSFISGKSQFGNPQEPPPAVVGFNQVTLFKEEILIDCDNAIISLPACSSFGVKFLHTAKYDDILVWPVGSVLGPQFRVNIGYSYGTPKSIQNWYTDIATFLNYSGNPAQPDPNAMWTKPQFAEALTLNICGLTSDLSTLSGYITLNFFDSLMNHVHQVRYIAPFTTFPLVRWPQTASYVSINVVNITNSAMIPDSEKQLKICPVHAIRI